MLNLNKLLVVSFCVSPLIFASCGEKKDEESGPITNQKPNTTSPPPVNSGPATSNGTSSNTTNSESRCSVDVQPLAGDPYPTMFLKKQVVIAQDILINSNVYDFGNVDTTWIPSLFIQGGVQTKTPDPSKVYCAVQTYEDEYNSGKGFKRGENVVAIKSGTKFVVTDAGYATNFIGPIGGLVSVEGFTIKDRCSFDKYLYAVSCFKKSVDDKRQPGEKVTFDEAQAALGNFVTLSK
jgi:hypothetical protein